MDAAAHQSHQPAAAHTQSFANPGGEWGTGQSLTDFSASLPVLPLMQAMQPIAGGVNPPNLM